MSAAEREGAIAEALTAYLVARGDRIASAAGDITVAVDGGRAVVRQGGATFEVVVVARRRGAP